MHATELTEVRNETAEALDNLAEANHENQPRGCVENTGFILKLVSGSMGFIVGCAVLGIMIQAYMDKAKLGCTWYEQNNCSVPLIHDACEETEDMPSCKLSSVGAPIGFSVLGAVVAFTLACGAYHRRQAHRDEAAASLATNEQAPVEYGAVEPAVNPTP
ncbi:MAG: hypothetical protein K0S29_1428 [Gammaproteobacteria bacterium]|jgi:hypothetical protein|nr:hypothetical protein [Gammaproteobacteria bacterium]